MRRYCVCIIVLLVALPMAGGQELLIDGFEDVNEELWETGGQKEVSFGFDGEHVIEGEQALHIHVARSARSPQCHQWGGEWCVAIEALGSLGPRGHLTLFLLLFH